MTGLVRDSDTELPYVADDRVYLAPSVTWRRDARTSVTVLTMYQRDATGPFRSYSPQVRQRLPENVFERYRTTFLGEPTFDAFEQRQGSLGTIVEHRLGRAWTVRQDARVGRVDVDYNFMNITTFTPALEAVRRARSFDERLTSVAIDNRASAHVTSGRVEHDVLLGLDYQRRTWSQIEHAGAAPAIDLFDPVYGQPIAPLTLAARQEQRGYQVGAYAQDRIKLTPRWIATVGVRHDWSANDTIDQLTTARTEQDDRAVTGRAGLTFLAHRGLAPYVSWATSFLPTAGTNFFGAPFEPTKGQQYEVGVKFQPGTRPLLFTLAGFNLTQRNVLTLDPDPAHIAARPGVQVQTGEVRSRGVEVEMNARVAAALTMRAAYAVQDVEVTASTTGSLGKTPVLLPTQSASLWLDYTVPHGVVAGLGVGAGVRYNGTTFADAANTERNAALTLFDAAIHYDLGHWRAAVNATNLFDKVYETCSSGTCYFGARQQVVARLTYRW